MKLLQLGRVCVLIRREDLPLLQLAVLVELLDLDGDGESLDVRAVVLQAVS